MMTIKQVAILGSTGSIGVNTLDVIRAHPERFRVVALTAAKQIDLLAQQCVEFKPVIAVVSDADGASRLSKILHEKKINTQVLHGPQALVTAVIESGCDTVMAAIVGAAGLVPVLAAAKAGKRVLLANKEALVMSGDLFIQAMRLGAVNCFPLIVNTMPFFNACPVNFQKILILV